MGNFNKMKPLKVINNDAKNHKSDFTETSLIFLLLNSNQSQTLTLVPFYFTFTIKCDKSRNADHS